MFVPYYLHNFLRLYGLQTRKLSQFLLITVNIFSQALVSALNSIVLLQGPNQGLRVLFKVLSGRFLFYQKQRKISQNDHSLSLVVILCHMLYHSLFLVVPVIAIPCHSLPFVVTSCATRCHSLWHSLSLVALLVATRCYICHSSAFLSPLRHCSVGKSCCQN